MTDRDTKASTTHTPGPWTLVDTSIVAGDVCIAVLESDGEYAAPDEEREANGSVLAAAPELLAATVEALDYLASQHTSVTSGQWDDSDAETVANGLETAIAKARGGA